MKEKRVRRGERNDRRERKVEGENSSPVLMLIIPKVFDSSKTTRHTSICIEVINNSLPHVQIIRISCGLAGGGNKGIL